MILVNGCSFTSGKESRIAWPDLLPDTVNIATPGSSNDHIMSSTVFYIKSVKIPDYVIIAWTSPDRIDISGKHLTATSQARYGKTLVDEVFKDWKSDWARTKFLTQVDLLHGFLESKNIPHIFVSTFDIQTWAQGPMNDFYYGWPDQGIVEWMGDCPKGPGGHPLELGHQRIAERINEYIRNLGWFS
jgi:lysophospholipase L1-like esterase